MTKLRIQQRKRIYLGCEGQSEQSYGARLAQIADLVGLHLSFDNDVLRPGGGDPLALVHLAVRRIKRKETRRDPFAVRAILLDEDKIGEQPARDSQIDLIARANRLHLIWQKPCHEGFLLRHLQDQQTARPLSSDLAMRALKAAWVDYEKAMPAIQLARRIDREAIQRASSVEDDFREFLRMIGFLRIG